MLKVSKKASPNSHKYTATFIKNGKRQQVTMHARDLLTMGRYIDSKYKPDRYISIK